jgi:hypothetical protein
VQDSKTVVDIKSQNIPIYTFRYLNRGIHMVSTGGMNEGGE